jgi:hypothetical protein
MKPYFEKMDGFGKELKPGRVKRAAASADQLRDVEAGIDAEKKKVEQAGFPTEKINKRGSMTAALALQSPGQRRRDDQRCRRSREDRRALGGRDWFRQQGHGRCLAARSAGEHPAGHRSC